VTRETRASDGTGERRAGRARGTRGTRGTRGGRIRRGRGAWRHPEVGGGARGARARARGNERGGLTARVVSSRA
jgi:hypothetical protein